MKTKRLDGRGFTELRPMAIRTSVAKYAEGSALIELGDTRVQVTASIDEKVPPFLRGSGQGWVTSEYALLPRSTQQRVGRDQARGGRSQEIQRLIGRALRAAVDLKNMGERSIMLDCDVLQADGGTRTASITAAWVALMEGMRWLKDKGLIVRLPLQTQVAAISVGIVEDEIYLDLTYEEDSRAQVDFNVVMTEKGRLVELQGTGEGRTFTREEMDEMVQLAWQGIQVIFGAQKQALGWR
jgi:ribonuclease PH